MLPFIPPTDHKLRLVTGEQTFQLDQTTHYAIWVGKLCTKQSFQNFTLPPNLKVLPQYSLINTNTANEIETFLSNTKFFSNFLHAVFWCLLRKSEFR